MGVMVGFLVTARGMRVFPGVGKFLYLDLGTHVCKKLLQCSCYFTKK